MQVIYDSGSRNGKITTINLTILIRLGTFDTRLRNSENRLRPNILPLVANILTQNHLLSLPKPVIYVTFSELTGSSSATL